MSNRNVDRTRGHLARVGATVILLLAAGCERHRGESPRGRDASIDAQEATRELRRAVCAAMPSAPMATGVQRRAMRAALRGARVASDRGWMPAAGGFSCILASQTLHASQHDPPEGVETNDPGVTFGSEQRRAIAPAPVRSDVSYLLSMVDDAWLRTLHDESSALEGETGAGLREHCARIATLRPPDPAAMQSRVDARIVHFLATGDPDVADDGGLRGIGAEALLAAIAARCGFVDAAP